MLTDSIKADLELAVWECLDRVPDPELDEPVTDMGFVEKVDVSDARVVTVDFRLPTYWCAPNFAFLMAIGMRRAVAALPWVHKVTVLLHDHCFGDRVNEGVNSGRAYSEVFAEYCDGAQLDEVMEKFDGKAFERRQEVVLLGLQEQGKTAQEIVDMSLEELQNTDFVGEQEVKQKPRYLELLLSSGLALNPDDKAFPTWDGGEILPDELSAHLNRLRGTRINMEFNGALCRGLAKTRYKEVEIGPDGPMLVDFIAGRVPPRAELRQRG